MRTDIEKQFLIEHGMDPEAEGKLIDNLFTYPKFIKFRERMELNNREDKNTMEENQGPNTIPPQAPSEPVAASTAPVQEQPREVIAEQANTQVAPQNAFSGLDNSGEIEKKKFDPTPYIGKDLFIEYIEERKGEFGYYIKLYSQVVDNGDWEIRASAIYGLEEDANGKLGWPEGSKLYNFLKKYNVAHYRDLLQAPTTAMMEDDKKQQFRRISGGFKTQIKVQTRLAKDGNEYLTF